MSFQVNKDTSGKVVKKTINAGIQLENVATGYNVSAPSALFNTRNYSAEVVTVTTSSGSATLTNNSLDILTATPGTASPGKALISNSDNTINGLNVVRCKSIRANGVLIDPNNSAEAAVPATDYFTGVTPGAASASKVLVADGNKSISGIKKVYGQVKDLVEFGSEQSAGMTFANNLSLPAGDYYDITYSVDLKKYLIVGKNVTLLSTSGSTWTTNVTSMSITFVKWVPHKGRFYGVASSGIYTSQDGITWVQAFDMTGLTSVAVGYNTAIAVGPSKQYYSSDSITWTSVTTTDANYAIAYGDSKFVIVGTNISKTATDAAVPVFTAVTITAGAWRDVDYGNGVFIAVNGSSALVNKFLTNTSGYKWATDSNTWNPVESELTTGWDRIYFLNDYFYVTSVNPASWESHVYYTKNGTEWYRFKHTLDGQLAGIAYSPIDKKIVFASRGGDYSKDPTNGVASILRPRPCAFPRFTYSGVVNSGPTTIKEANGLIFGMSVDCLFVSTDGYKFQKAYLDVAGANQFDTISRDIRDIAYSPSLGLYVASSAYWVGVYTSLIKSTDGITWTDISTAPAISAGTIVWSSAHSKFITCVTNAFVYSSDGITWTSVSLMGCRFIQIIDSVVYVAHYTNLSKIETDLTVSLVAPTGYGSIYQFMKAGSTFYRSDYDGVWSSTNLTTWTNMILFNNSSGLTYIPDLDAIVTFTADNYVRVYKNSTWYSFPLVNCIASAGARYPCWSTTYKKIFAPQSFGNGSVCMTSSLIGQTTFASLLKPKVYKTLPSYLDSLALQDDNFYKAMQRSNSLVSFGGFTFTGSTEITKLVYDRGNNFWVGLKTAPTTANPAVRFVNGFSGQLSAVNFHQYIPYSTDSSLYMYNDGTNQNLQMALLTSSTTLGTILHSAVSGTLTFAVNRFKKHWHRNFFYHFNGSYYYFYVITPVATGTLVSVGAIYKTETSVDYTMDKAGDYFYVLTSTPAIIKRKVGFVHAAGGNVDGTFVKSTALPAGTYYQLDYFKDKFILTKSDKVLYSSNCETWEEAFTGTFTRHNMNYIIELDIMTIVTTNTFAYSRDGSTWIQLTTPTSDAWTSCDYNARAATFILHARTTGRILLTSPIMVTTTNACAPVGMYANGNKLSHYALGQNITPYNQTHALDTTGGLSNDQINGDSCNFVRSSNTLTISSNINILFAKTDNTVSGLKINGTDSSISEIAFRGLPSIKLTDQTNKNGIAITNKFGNLKAGNANLTTLTNNEIAPLVTADSDRNISLDSLGSQTVVVNGGPLKYSQLTAPTRSYSITDYFDFKLGTFTNSQSGIYDSAYSPTLDTLVLLINGNSTGTGDAVAVSKDKGQTWTRIRLNITSVYGSTDYNRKLMWSPEANAFISVGNQVVYYSYNGYSWTTLAVLFGNNPHVFYDSKTSRITVVCASRVAYASVSNLSSWTVITTMAISYQQAEYSPVDDLYYVITRVSTNISTTPNIYTATAPALTTRVTTTVAYYLQYFKGAMYYIDTLLSVRKNTNATLVLNVTNSRNIYRLQYEPSLDILLAFSSLGFFWTSDASTWNWITYPSHEITNNLASTVEGIRSEIHFVGDKAILTSNASGNVLVSDTIVTKKTIAPNYLDEMVQNRYNIDTLGNANSYNSELFMRHSNTSLNMYSAAYGAGKYLSVGTNVNMYGSNLKQTPTYATHTGNWVDVVYDGSRFVKISSTLISYATTPNAVWTDLSLPNSSSWFKLLHNSGVYTIISTSEIKTSNNLTDWTDATPSAFGTINGAEYVNGSLVVLGVDKIYTGSAIVPVQGTWYDIAFGKGLYLVAGNGFMARGRSLASLKRTFVPKDYHSVVYVRPLNDFVLLSKTVASAQPMSRYMYASPTTHIIRSPDGLNWYPGLNFTTRTSTALTYYMSGLYYFEEVDQFFIPLNNTTNKICMYSNYTVANKANVKITTPSSIRLGTTDGSIDIARGSDMTTASPLRFNVFQDSAAKPATSTWTTASDRRVKEDIIPADLNICVSNVKSMPLKYYKWRDQYLTSEHSNDRHKLGWIAQDVEKVLPKSVGKLNLFGMEDCRTLNNDQIVANMYGAIKMLVKKIEEKEQAVADAGL
jgi:hypothetical protein